MLVILFRSTLTSRAGRDYADTAAALAQHAATFEGFIDAKDFIAEDGERLSVVRWKDLPTLARWRTDLQHVAAKAAGRERWYESYQIEIASIIEVHSFEAPGSTQSRP